MKSSEEIKSDIISMLGETTFSVQNLITILNEIVDSAMNKMEVESVTNIIDTVPEAGVAGESYIVRDDNLVYYYSTETLYEAVDYPVGKVLCVEGQQNELFIRRIPGWGLQVIEEITYIVDEFSDITTPVAGDSYIVKSNKKIYYYTSETEYTYFLPAPGKLAQLPIGEMFILLATGWAQIQLVAE